MVDRISASKTDRDWENGAINDLDMTVKVVIPSGQGKTKSGTLDEMGWQPLQLRMANGVNPNVMTFKIAFLDSSQTDNKGERIPVNIVNQQKAIDFFRPSAISQVSTVGFSAGEEPITKAAHDSLSKRQNKRIDASKLPYVVIHLKTRSKGGKGRYLGRYWLSNIDSSQTDVVIAFSDARYLWMKKFIDGAFFNYYPIEETTAPSLVFDAQAETIFNKNDAGNRNILSERTQDQRHYSFYPDYFLTKAIAEADDSSQIEPRYRAARWTLYDMVKYLEKFLYGGINKLLPMIKRIVKTEPTWDLWRRYGGLNTPELDITGQSVLKAIDMIVKAAGNYEWTIEPYLDSNRQPWQIRIFERNRWEKYGASKQRSENESFMTPSSSWVNIVMPKRTPELPTRGVALASTATNVASAKIDEQCSKQISRVVTKGDNLIFETTLSNIAEGDTSCLAYGSAATGIGQVASLEYLDDLAGWELLYQTTSGTAVEKERAASKQYPYAYRVIATKPYIRSTENTFNGMAFLPKFLVPSLMQRMQFLPYRLPKAPAYAEAPGDSRDMLDVLIWVRESGASDWTLLDDDGRSSLQIGYSIDPQQGIRFSKPMVVITGSAGSEVFTPYEVRVTADIIINERLQVEVYRSDYIGDTITIEAAQGEYQKGVRWNAIQIDGDIANAESAVIFDDIAKLSTLAQGEFAKYDRLRAPCDIVIPWIDTLFQVGDWIEYLQTGSSAATSSVPVTKRDIKSPVVGVVFDFNQRPYTTSIRAENWSL